MFKIVIADDEMLVRLGMKSMIAWEEHGFEVVGDAGDGQKALELIETHLPDIVLTDIVMPHMTGLELIAQVKKKYEFIRFVMLSSHSDYNYVREAMKLGAEDYILKASIKPEELLHLLTDMAEKIKNDRGKLIGNTRNEGVSASLTAQQRKMNYLTFLCEDQLDDLQLAKYSEELEWDVTVLHRAVLFVKLHRSSQQQSETENKLVEKSFIHVLEEQLNRFYASEVIPYKENEYIVMLSGNEMLTATLLPELAKDIITAARRFLKLTISVGMGTTFSHLAEFKHALLQAKEASKYSFYEGNGQSYSFKQHFFNADVEQIFTKVEEERLSQAIEICDVNALQEIIGQFIERIVQRKPPLDKNMELVMELLHCMKTNLKRQGVSWEQVMPDETPLFKQVFSLESMEEQESWLQRIVANMIGILSRKRKETYREEIQTLIDYINLNYTEDISLKSAAKVANMSESYLSYLFKKETNQSFVEYLTEIRMKKAAKLLKTTAMASYEIAELIGYENINYFGRTFKKVMGVSPTQYREEYAGKK